MHGASEHIVCRWLADSGRGCSCYVRCWNLLLDSGHNVMASVFAIVILVARRSLDHAIGSSFFHVSISWLQLPLLQIHENPLQPYESFPSYSTRCTRPCPWFPIRLALDFPWCSLCTRHYIRHDMWGPLHETRSPPFACKYSLLPNCCKPILVYCSTFNIRASRTALGIQPSCSIMDHSFNSKCSIKWMCLLTWWWIVR